jgi:hypothetical protein
MNKKQWILLVAGLVLIGGSAGVLTRLHAMQRLGPPGVKTSRLEGSDRLRVELPERVLDYSSKELPVEKVVLDFLPRDTSFGQRLYEGPDGFHVLVNAVLMGTDRTSLHKPEFCLGGSGWVIDRAASAEAQVRIERPVPYDLPVIKLIATKQITGKDGQKMTARGLYVYWFVADNAYTAQHWQRMVWMASNMMRTGVLQRWAYISYFASCPPGQEEATFERMKKMIAASVPEYQLTPSGAALASSKP